MWRLRARWLASDPDLSRLRLAARAALAAALTEFGLLALAVPLALPATVPMMGAAMAMFASIVGNDPDPRQNHGTYLRMPLAIGASLTVVAAASPWPALGLAFFVATIALSILAQRAGDRGTALGLMAFNAYFFALFFRVGLRDLPAHVAAGALGVAVAFGVRYGLLAEHPGRTLRRTLRAYPAMVALALDHLLDRERVRKRAMQRMNVGALILEDRLRLAGTLLPPGEAQVLRHRVFALELAAGRINTGARQILADPDLPAAVREALPGLIELARRAVLREPDAAAACLRRAQAVAASVSAPARLALLCSRFAVALEDLCAAARFDAAVPNDAEPQTPTAPVPQPPPAAQGLHPSSRLAIQAALACTISLIVGRAISPDRWFWAVLASYLVIAPTHSRGEILVRAWRRSLGTVVGVFLGMALAALAQGHARLEAGLLFACIFFGLYSIKTSYSLMMMWFTALLALLYSITGRYTPGIMFVRVAETLAGAAVGALTATLVLPASTRSRARLALETALSALAAQLAHLAAAARAGRPASLDTTRVLDRSLDALRSAAEPLARGTLRMTGETVELVRAASTVGFYARHLATPGLLDAAVRQSGARVAEAIELLARNASALNRALSSREAPQLATVRPAIEAMLPAAGATSDPALAAHWMSRLDDEMNELASHLRPFP